jgi:hypothetical protein
MGKNKLTPNEALDMAESMSSGEGAQMALAAEMCGMDYADFCDSFISDPEFLSEYGRSLREGAVKGLGKRFLTGNEKKLAKLGVTIEKRNDGCHWLLFKDGKRIGDFWPTTQRWKIGSNKGNDVDRLLKHIAAMEAQ